MRGPLPLGEALKALWRVGIAARTHGRERMREGDLVSLRPWQPWIARKQLTRWIWLPVENVDPVILDEFRKPDLIRGYKKRFHIPVVQLKQLALELNGVAYSSTRARDDADIYQPFVDINADTGEVTKVRFWIEGYFLFRDKIQKRRI